MADKHLYIISGPNGAGKTTASYTVLPKILQCKEFVNADEIARGLSTIVEEQEHYKKIEEYVKSRTSQTD